MVIFLNNFIIAFTSALTNQFTTYIFLLPLVFLFLIYHKHKMLLAVSEFNRGNLHRRIRYLPALSGLILIFMALLINWYVFWLSTPFESYIITFPLVIIGLILFLFSYETLKQLIFPLLFLFIILPSQSTMFYNLGDNLSNITSGISSFIATLIGVPITVINENGNSIITINNNATLLQFNVGLIYSGLISLICIGIIAILIAYLSRDKIWKKAAFVTISIFLAFLLNILLLTILLVAGNGQGADFPLNNFFYAGELILIVIGIGLFILTNKKLLKAKIFLTKKDNHVHYSSNPDQNTPFCFICAKILNHLNKGLNKLDLLKILSIFIISLFVLSIQTPIFTLTRSPASVEYYNLNGYQTSAAILPPLEGHNLQFMSRNSEFEQRTNVEMALSFSYNSANKSVAPIWVSVDIASTRSSLYKWEILVSQNDSNSRVAQIELSDIQISDDPNIVGRYFVFEYTNINLTQAIIYWYDSAIFTTNSSLKNKYVQVSMIGYPDDLTQLSQMKDELLNLAKLTINYWEPIKLGSSISSSVSQNGLHFAVIILSFLLLIVVYYHLEIIKVKRAYKKMYSRLSLPNKILLDILEDARKQKIFGLESIAEVYNRTTKQIMSVEEFMQVITSLRKTGILQAQIINKDEEPICVWKTFFANPAPFMKNIDFGLIKSIKFEGRP